MKTIDSKNIVSVQYNAQRGAVLIVGLIMVLLITIVGLAAVRGSSMQELMAGNLRDSNVAFQRAEAGLRVGEYAVDANPDIEYEDISLSDPTNTWNATAWQEKGESIGDAIGELARPPRYKLESLVMPIGKVAASDGSGIDGGSVDMVPEPKFFRVSSWSYGDTDTSEAVLQSTVKLLE